MGQSSTHRCVRAAASALFAACIFSLHSAWAYTPTVTASGQPVRWGPGFKLNLAGNPVNSSGLSPMEFFDSVLHGLQRWKTAAGGTVNFDYWQGTDPTIYEPNSNFNGLSSIYFASNMRGGTTPISPNVLGLTQVWYNTDNDRILEADVILNDKNYEFTTNPADTSGPGAGSTRFGAGKSKVFIENVITHELGHAFGLSHTGTMQSTMLFMESPEQAYLGCDELVGIRAVYPGGDADSRGEVNGTVVGSDGKPVFGAHVLALSRDRGTLLASSLTDRSGRFAIRALEPGTYYLEVEPFFAGSQALPAYFSQMGQGGGCAGGRDFSRSFVTDGSGYLLRPIEIAAGRATNAGAIQIQCSSGPGAAVMGHPGALSESSAPAIYTGGGGFGAIDQLPASKRGYYRLSRLSGRVELHALTHSLYSPVRVELALYDSSGSQVESTSLDRVYEGNSGFVDFDAMLKADHLPEGDYFVSVGTSPLNAVYYPGGQIPLDTVPFVVLMGTVNAGTPALAGTIPQNARCALTERFADYTSPPGNPPRIDVHQDDRVGACGTIAVIDDEEGGSSGSGSGSGPSAGAIAGWFLPYVLMLLGARAFRRRGLLRWAFARSR